MMEEGAIGAKLGPTTRRLLYPGRKGRAVKRRLIAAILAASISMVFVNIGLAAALTPDDDFVPQQVAVPGSTTGEGIVLTHDSDPLSGTDSPGPGRNPSCSATRDIRNNSGISADIRIHNDAGLTLSHSEVAPGEHSVLVIDHNVITVPIFIQVNGGPLVELTQVGPLARCGESVPTTTTTEPPSTTTTQGTTTTTSATTTTTAATTTTTAGTTTTAILPTTTVAPTTSVAPSTSISPTVTTASPAVDIRPAPKTLPVTGRNVRMAVVLAVGLVVGGMAYVVAGPKRHRVRRRV